MTQYDYYGSYINDCKNGRPNALLGTDQKLLMFALTSGTTSQAKYIPVTQAFAQSYRRGWNIWGIQAYQDHPDALFRKILQVASPHEQEKTAAGIACGAISGLLAKNQKPVVRQFYALPNMVAYIPEAGDRYYTIMRLALCEDIAFISTANPSTTLTLAQTAEKEAMRIIRDIHDGTLRVEKNVPEWIRRGLSSRLNPRPQRAMELECILEKYGRLLPRHYWNISFLANWTGGTLSMYLPQLRDYFGNVPIRDIGLLASEGRMSIPLEDNTPGGILDIEANVYEFIPEAEVEGVDLSGHLMTLPEGLVTLRPDEVEPGANYYLILTNQSGLYRYHIGDVVRVNGFAGTTPVIEFLSKGAHTSSITGEKLTEHQAVRAVREAADECGMEVETFIMMPEWGDPPRYGVAVQLRKLRPTERLEVLAGEIDRRLEALNIEYTSKRKSGRLGPVSVKQYAHGELTERDEVIKKANQGRNEQFKHRFLYNQPVENVVAG